MSTPSDYVLVVDDDPGIRDTVAEMLDFEGFAVRTAPDGAVALAMVERERPGVVLLDMRMPVMDGWQFARAVHDRGLHLPIVVMTAAENAQAWCDEIHGDACLPKPFDMDFLIETVARFRSSSN